MTPAERLVTVTERNDLAEALQKLVRADVEQLLVVDGERLVGMLARRDIGRWIDSGRGGWHTHTYAH